VLPSKVRICSLEKVPGSGRSTTFSGTSVRWEFVFLSVESNPRVDPSAFGRLLDREAGLSIGKGLEEEEMGERKRRITRAIPQKNRIPAIQTFTPDTTPRNNETSLNREV